jgi:hypothetical protein
VISPVGNERTARYGAFSEMASKSVPANAPSNPFLLASLSSFSSLVLKRWIFESCFLSFEKYFSFPSEQVGSMRNGFCCNFFAFSMRYFSCDFGAVRAKLRLIRCFFAIVGKDKSRGVKVYCGSSSEWLIH